MEDLDFNNIDDSLSLGLFGDDSGTEEIQEKTTEKTGLQEDDNTEEWQQIDPDSLFEDDDTTTSESVGEEEIQNTKEPQVDDDEGNSSADFYSSIANAMVNDGVLEYLDKDTISTIKDADTFREALESEIKNRFDTQQQELLEAMGYGADVRKLHDLQEMITYLDGIDPNMLDNEEDQQVVDLRKQLIGQHYTNLGMNENQVKREIDKSFNAGTDIDDAKEALEAQKNLYKQVYQNEINKAKLAEEQRQTERQARQKKMIDTILETEEPFAGVKIDKRIRNKIVENIYTPSVKGTDGNYYSKLQAYQNEHPDEFLQKIGTIYTITDGFKNLDKLIGKAVQTEQKHNIQNLENLLKNQKNYGNNVRYVGNGRTNEQKPNSRYTLNI